MLRARARSSRSRPQIRPKNKPASAELANRINWPYLLLANHDFADERSVPSLCRNRTYWALGAAAAAFAALRLGFLADTCVSGRTVRLRYPPNSRRRCGGTRVHEDCYALGHRTYH